MPIVFFTRADAGDGVVLCYLLGDRRILHGAELSKACVPRGCQPYLRKWIYRGPHGNTCLAPRRGNLWLIAIGVILGALTALLFPGIWPNLGRRAEIDA